MKLKAFTLAEVLITLMIIGIVAALTIPSVISNYQQQEFKTGLKKAVSVLNSAIQTNMQEDGETPYENWDLFSYLQRHMSVIKTNVIGHCYNETTGEVPTIDDEHPDCSTGFSDPITSVRNNVFYTTDGMRFEVPDMGKGSLYLHEAAVNIGQQRNAGMMCMYGHCSKTAVSNGFCGSYGLNSNPNNVENTPCVLIVDVNGDKKPNPPVSFAQPIIESGIDANTGLPYSHVNPVNQSFSYSYPSPTDKKLQDIFTIMITEKEAIPFGVVAQRAMYSK